MSAPRRVLDPDQRRRLEAGEHEAVARELLASHRYVLAGQVLEQIWDFGRACAAYLEGDAWTDALRCALEARDPSVTERALQALERLEEAETKRDAVALLERRGRHADAARLLDGEGDAALLRARALLRAADPLGAARTLAETGRVREALDALGRLEEKPSHAEALALGARLLWELGDAEGTARYAQSGLRLQSQDPQLPALLARALTTLGHDLAAQIVLQGQQSEEHIAPVRGRYHVTGVLPATIAGAAYVGLDRVTLQEVEIHLLLADYTDGEAPDPAVRDAISRFAGAAESANTIGHAAIRPIVRIDAEDGLLVMPRAEGPGLRSLIRSPGLLDALPRARAMIAFLLEGLAAAHARGLVHGSVMPSQIVCDAAGRPVLGPFGVHHLAGLVATRTGGLEEVLSITAPELRANAAPSQASDVFSVGAIYLALLLGNVGGDPMLLPPEERELMQPMLAAVPEQRPSAAEAFARLRVPVPDVSRVALGGPSSAAESQRGRALADPGLGEAVVVSADESWTEGLLDALCAARNPWLQTILDRDGSTFWLAPWPEGCRTLGEGAAWGEFVTLEASEDFDDELAAALRSRMRADAAVATPAGEWMIALDRLLCR